MMKRLENKTAIVTGGNSGIGKATAILFAKEGADLVLCARRKEALDEVAEECRKYGVQVVTVKADVSSHEDCSAVVKAAIDTFGKVDILVNNAGIVDKHRPITECTDEWWDEIIAIDQSSLFYMMKDTIPHMMEAGQFCTGFHELYDQDLQTGYDVCTSDRSGYTEASFWCAFEGSLCGDRAT